MLAARTNLLTGQPAKPAAPAFIPLFAASSTADAGKAVVELYSSLSVCKDCVNQNNQPGKPEMCTHSRSRIRRLVTVTSQT